MSGLCHFIIHQGRIISLLRDSALRQQFGIPVQVQFRFIQGCLALHLGSLQGCVVQPQQKLPCCDMVIFSNKNLYDTPCDLRTDIHIVQGAEAAGSGNAFLQVSVLHRSGFHRFCFGRFLALVILVTSKARASQNC